MKLTKRTSILVGGATVCLTVFGYLLYAKSRREEPLDHFSRRMVAAFQRGDSDTLYSSMMEREREATGLDRAKFAQFVNWTRNALSSYRETGGATVEMSKDGFVAMADQRYGSNNAVHPVFEFQSNRTQNGPRAFFTYAMLVTALTAKYESKFANEPERVRRWHALREGLEKERPFFESIALKGYVDSGQNTQYVSLAKLYSFSTKAADVAENNLRLARARIAAGLRE